MDGGRTTVGSFLRGPRPARGYFKHFALLTARSWYLRVARDFGLAREFQSTDIGGLACSAACPHAQSRFPKQGLRLRIVHGLVDRSGEGVVGSSRPVLGVGRAVGDGRGHQVRIEYVQQRRLRLSASSRWRAVVAKQAGSEGTRCSVRSAQRGSAVLPRRQPADAIGMGCYRTPQTIGRVPGSPRRVTRNTHCGGKACGSAGIVSEALARHDGRRRVPTCASSPHLTAPRVIDVLGRVLTCSNRVPSEGLV